MGSSKRLMAQHRGKESSAQREWAAKKQAQHEEEWGAGEKWLIGQFAANSSTSQTALPSAIQRTTLNPDEMPVLDEEAMGYDINVPKCYRQLKQHTAMPEEKTECEELEAASESAAPEEAAPEDVAPEEAAPDEAAPEA